MKKLYVALAAFAAVTAVSLFAAGFAIHGWLAKPKQTEVIVPDHTTEVDSHVALTVETLS